MAEPLSRYSNTRDTTNPNAVKGDANTPFSFKEWSNRNFGTIANKENQQYERYVRDWYSSRDEEATTAENIKEDYIQLLKQITLTFSSSGEGLQLSNTDFEDDTQLKLAIPIYAAKIKEIAQYFIFKREAIRRSKLKYNLVNTNEALERLFYEYILKAFTRNKFANEYTAITDESILSAVPDLSASQNMQIVIEEVYDDANYFDRDPSMPVSSYFINTSASSAFLTAKGFTDDEFEWLYSTGVSQLCADNPLLWAVENVIQQYDNGIPLSAVENDITYLLNDYNRIKLTQKYIGEHQYIISGGNYATPSGVLTYEFNGGNNWFFWPSGENLFDISNTQVDAITLSSCNLIDSGATGATRITGADVVFTERDGELKGAWLQLIDQSAFSNTMSARFFNGKTTFAYPYPGYGLSGEDLPWTGREYNNINRTFQFLEPETQSNIWALYWNSLAGSTSSFDPVYINESTLAESGAGAATKLISADLMMVRDSNVDDNNNGVYTDDQSYAWLYRMDKTDLPIFQGDNTLYWPFQRVEDALGISASADQCAPVYLSSIDLGDFLGAVAAQSPNAADKIFIKKSINSTDYKEGAWLSGSLLAQPSAITDSTILSGTYQPNLTMRVLGGSLGTFVWQNNPLSADDVFKSFQHQTDCSYLNDKQFSLFNEKPWQDKDIEYNHWQNCSCRAVLYTPLGHPGDTFDEYDGMADYIVALSEAVSSFNFSDWTGHDGNDYTESSDFGWFKLDGSYQIEPDVGWGSGNWVTNTGSPFMLSANVMYLYFRNDMKRDNPATTVPYLITKHKNTGPNTNNAWMKLRYNTVSNEWEDVNEVSDMIIKPGDFLYYNHPTTYSIILTSQHYEFEQREREVIPSFSDFAIRSTFPGTESQVPTASTTWETYGLSSQYIPGVTPISAISEVNIYQVSSLPLTFYTAPTGPITLSASFEDLSNNTITTTLTTVTTVVVDTYEYINDTINFVVNVQLSGWNYTTNAYDVTSLGAKPFWVEAYDSADDYTKQKGINIWAGSPVLVDDYNFVSQPTFSDVTFTENSYVEYTRRSNNAFTWVQTVNGNVSNDIKNWRKIVIDKTATSNLSSVLHNNVEQLIISATETDSDITFDISAEGEPLQINYFARNSFTWTQEYTDSTKGIAPTGGNWNPIVSGLLVEADQPYANLTNRHFPTYASVPYIGELYTSKERGGFMIPQNLGVSVALTQSQVNALETRGQSGSGAIFQDTDLYNTDYGLTNTTQYTPVSTTDSDASWIKAKFIEAEKAGMVKNPDVYQEMVPYQTTYETARRNAFGVLQQQDSNTQKVYIANELGGYELVEFETDIFGNQYGLYEISGS